MFRTRLTQMTLALLSLICFDTAGAQTIPKVHAAKLGRRSKIISPPTLSIRRCF
jgi:hypothetical protein